LYKKIRTFDIVGSAPMTTTTLLLASILQTSPSQPAPQFFTIETLFTAAGATTAVFTVTSVIRGLLPKLPPRWFAAFFALFLTIVGIHVNNQAYGPSTLLLAFINAAVVYAAAVGVNNITTAPAAGGTSAPGAPAAAAQSYRWWQ
jgi:uncharacterized membrane protein